MVAVVGVVGVVGVACVVGVGVVGVVGFDTCLHGVYVCTMLSCSPE